MIANKHNIILDHVQLYLNKGTKIYGRKEEWEVTPDKDTVTIGKVTNRTGVEEPKTQIFQRVPEEYTHICVTITNT